MDGRTTATKGQYDALCALVGPDDNISQNKFAFEVEEHVVVNHGTLRTMVANKRAQKPLWAPVGRPRELSEASRAFITSLVRNKQLTSAQFSARVIAKLMRALLEQGYLSDDALEPLSGGTLMDDLNNFEEDAENGEEKDQEAEKEGREWEDEVKGENVQAEGKAAPNC